MPYPRPGSGLVGRPAKARRCYALVAGALPRMNSPFLPDWVFAHAERRPESPALATPAVRLSYADLAARVRALAGHLTRSGVRPGDRIVVALPNAPATVVASLAVQALGGTALEVNRKWEAEILAGIAAQGGARQAIIWGQDALTGRGPRPPVDAPRSAIRRLRFLPFCLGRL